MPSIASRGRRGRLWLGALVLVLGALVAGALVVDRASTSSAAGTPVYQVTLAARTCPTYTDVTANRARNNLMESLQDLGADTPYSGDQVVSPSVEASVQPNCTALPGWQFTLGDGINGQVAGPWGKLSIVSNPDSLPPETGASTPLLDDQGNPTGQSIAGATTITLTAAQVARSENHSLWIQGGTTTEPVMNDVYPGEYGFAALRCATDNVNGDNVEYIAFPQGVTHVFCFAYYVRPPPTSGSIVIQKAVVGAPSNVDYDFGFSGNVSYNPNGAFTLNPSTTPSMTFYRAAGVAWTVTEDDDPNFPFTSVTCSTQAGGTSTGTPIPTNELPAGAMGGVSIDLVAGDTITCTFTDTYTPPPPAPGDLDIAKVSTGGVGTFPFTVGDTQDPTAATLTATTTEPGVAVDATVSSGSIPPAGPYTVSESLPSAVGGTWELTDVQCDNATVSPPFAAGDTSVTVTPAPSGIPLCTFFDSFVPGGRITVSKVTVGGTDSVDFQIASSTDPSLVLFQSATTTADGLAAEATGDSSESLPLGTYTVEELTPGNDETAAWSLQGVTCNGSPANETGGVVTVTLTAASPSALCTFTNSFVATVPTTTTTTAATTVPTAPVSPITPVVVHPTG